MNSKRFLKENFRFLMLDQVTMRRMIAGCAIGIVSSCLIWLSQHMLLPPASMNWRGVLFFGVAGSIVGWLSGVLRPRLCPRCEEPMGHAQTNHAIEPPRRASLHGKRIDDDLLFRPDPEYPSRTVTMAYYLCTECDAEFSLEDFF